MIFSLLLLVLVVQAYGQMTDEKHTFEGYQIQDQGTCKPECGEGQCCVKVPMMMVSRKRAASGDLIGPSETGYYNYFCQAVKQRGEKCLLHNPHQEWCDCEAGLTCTKSDDVTLSNFYGICQ